MFDLRLRLRIGVVLVALALTACEPATEDAAKDASGVASSDAYVVDVIGREMVFEAPDEIPSGWITFQFKNEGRQTHFMLLDRLPEGRTFEDYIEAVPAFDEVWYALRDGELNKEQAGQELGRLLPEWWLTGLKQIGGPGLVSPGGSVRTTVKLDPGTYVMECYVKSPEGEFHGSMGMVRLLTVTELSSGASPPEADVKLTLSNAGIDVEGEMTPGTHTIAVLFAEHPEFPPGNDVHLIRIEPDTDMDKLVEWMDWMNVDGMRAPAPARFLGGAQEMPVGNTAYFTVAVEPGVYAWISEPTVLEKVHLFIVE